EASGQVARARCFAREDPIQVVIVPGDAPGRLVDKPRPTTQLIHHVRDYLDRRRLLTTRLEVLGPTYEDVYVRAEVVLKPQYIGRFNDVATELKAALRTFVHPLSGHAEESGWPMGRTLHKSELYYVLEKDARVDSVAALELRGPDHAPTENLYLDTRAFPYF